MDVIHTDTNGNNAGFIAYLFENAKSDVDIGEEEKGNRSGWSVKSEIIWLLYFPQATFLRVSLFCGVKWHSALSFQELSGHPKKLKFDKNYTSSFHSMNNFIDLITISPMLSIPGIFRLLFSLLILLLCCVSTQTKHIYWSTEKEYFSLKILNYFPLNV